MDALPKIRDEIEALPVADDNRFLLYDRSGLSEAQLVVSPEVMFLASRLDGATPLLNLATLYERETGGRIPLAQMEQVLVTFDEALFLDNSVFAAHYVSVRQDFLASPLRQAVCAGGAYPAEPGELRELLDSILRSAPPDEEEGRATNAPRPAPRGLIAPHMDFQRARATYGQVYRELSRFNPPEAVVILGTAHQPIRGRYALCDKDFAVPGGVVRVHTELTRWLGERLRAVPASAASYADDLFAHRFEHSVELQAVWLRHIWGDDVRIIPLLAGPLLEFLSQPRVAVYDPQIIQLREALHELSLRGVMLLASADLAHIGPRFGDERRIDRRFLEEVSKADRRFLQGVCHGHPEDLLDALAGHNDRYRLCGTGCIYALKSALSGSAGGNPSGRLLGYHQAVTPELEQAVTCAGALFE